jgi:hypothetical protein
MSDTPSNINAWAAMGNNSNKPKEGIRNLRITSGPNGAEQTYEVRFVGDPITFHKYFVNNRSAITADPQNCVITKKYGTPAGMRHAVNLINRADGLLYLAELPPSALNPVVAWAKRRKTNPGGKTAVDFSITVRGMKKNTRYEVVALDASTLTSEEEAMPRYDLEKLFKPTPEDEIEAKLYGNAGQPNAGEGQKPVAASAGKPAAQDLPF